MPNAKGGQEQTYCSRTCGYRTRRGCKPKDEARRFECGHCAKSFESTYHDAMYCSKRCKTAAWKAANPDRLSLLRQRERRPVRLLSCYVAKHCDRCGVAGGARRSWTLCPCCIRRDQREAARDAAKACAEAQHKAAGRVTECEECRSCFCPLYGSSAAALCRPCADARTRQQRRAAKKFREALKRGAAGGEHVRKEKVFERDGWLCRLCGVATPKHLTGTYEHNAPELDHIIPVTRDGLHTYANTQCLCRSCNGWKAARTMDEVIAELEG